MAIKNGQKIAAMAEGNSSASLVVSMLEIRTLRRRNKFFHSLAPQPAVKASTSAIIFSYLLSGRNDDVATETKFEV
jgi:hypothetical protein